MRALHLPPDDASVGDAMTGRATAALVALVAVAPARQPDGVHLSTAVAAVAATLVVDHLRADHAPP